jgi:chemotaxis protein CheX
MVRVKTHGGTTTITLPAALDATAAAELLSAMRKAVLRGRPLAIDCSDVTRLSTPCVQILLASEKALAAVDQTMAVSACSEEFAAAMNDFGLEEKLEAWRTAQ